MAAPGSRHLADCGKAAPAPTSKEEEEEDESGGCLRCQRRPLSAGTSHALSPHGRVSVWTLAAVAGPQRATRNEVILRTGWGGRENLRMGRDLFGSASQSDRETSAGQINVFMIKDSPLKMISSKNIDTSVVGELPL